MPHDWKDYRDHFGNKRPQSALANRRRKLASICNKLGEKNAPQLIDRVDDRMRAGVEQFPACAVALGDADKPHGGGQRAPRVLGPVAHHDDGVLLVTHSQPCERLVYDICLRRALLV